MRLLLGPLYFSLSSSNLFKPPINAANDEVGCLRRSRRSGLKRPAPPGRLRNGTSGAGDAINYGVQHLPGKMQNEWRLTITFTLHSSFNGRPRESQASVPLF